MPLELRIVEKSLAAAFDRTDILTLAMSHQMLAERRSIGEGLSAVEYVAGEDLVAGFCKVSVAGALVYLPSVRSDP